MTKSLKFYALKDGTNPGIYTNLNELNYNLDKSRGYRYQTFNTENEAREYLNIKDLDINREDLNDLTNYTFNIITDNSIESDFNLKKNEAIAYVDGSYNTSTKEYGAGVLLITHNKIYTIKESYNDSYNQYKHIAGEIMGPIIALDYAIDMNIDNIKIYHDFIGIQNHKNKKWKNKSKLTRSYDQYLKSIKSLISYKLIHVKSHSNIYYNDIADILAKEAVGIYNDYDMKGEITKLKNKKRQTLPLSQEVLNNLIPKSKENNENKELENKIDEETLKTIDETIIKANEDGEREFAFNLALKAIKILRHNKYGIISVIETENNNLTEYAYKEIILNNENIFYKLKDNKLINANIVKKAYEDKKQSYEINDYDLSIIYEALNTLNLKTNKNDKKDDIENIKLKLKSQHTN